MLMHGHFVVFEGRVLICIFLQGSILNVIEKTAFTNSMTIGEACSYCCFNSIIINLRVLSPWMYVYIHTYMHKNMYYILKSSSVFIYIQIQYIIRFVSISVSPFLSIYCRYLSKNEILLFFSCWSTCVDIFRSKVQVLYMYLCVKYIMSR